MHVTRRRRHEYLDRLANKFSGLPTEHFEGPAVRVTNPAVPVHDQRCVGRALQEEPLLVAGQHRASLAAPFPVGYADGQATGGIWSATGRKFAGWAHQRDPPTQTGM